MAKRYLFTLLLALALALSVGSYLLGEHNAQIPPVVQAQTPTPAYTLDMAAYPTASTYADVVHAATLAGHAPPCWEDEVLMATWGTSGHTVQTCIPLDDIVPVPGGG